MADKANGVQRLRELLAASCCAEPWRFNESTQTVVSGQSHPLARITEAAHRLTFAGTTGREGELIVEAINALPGLLADYEQLQAKLEAAERDARKWRGWREAQERIEAELPEGYAIELYCSPGDWSISLYDRTGKDLEIVDFDSTEDFVNRAIERAKEHAAIDAQRQEGK